MRYLIVLAATLVVLIASAIEAPKPAAPAGPAPSSEQSAEAPPPEAAEPVPAAKEEVEEELPPLPAGIVPAGPPPARFTPTEKVRADFPVSFPIDI